MAATIQQMPELFRTVVSCPASPAKIDYTTPVVMLGSCFAGTLGDKMRQLKFDITVNPFGTVYHPASAAQQLKRIITGEPYTVSQLQQHNGLWCSFDHHGRFSHPDPNICLTQINSELQQAHIRIAHARWLAVTFGSAWAYRLKTTGRITANCHRFPSADFDRIRFDVNEIYDLWKETIEELRNFNPCIRIIFTVSPIRHLRDGAHENQLSKAILLMAVERLCNALEYTQYFPAYEILLDELRDYRFYADDMTHPATIAINYIWHRFCACYITDATAQLMKTVEELVKAATHRPIHSTGELRNFAASCLEKTLKLQQQHPYLDFTDEIRRFQKIS